VNKKLVNTSHTKDYDMKKVSTVMICCIQIFSG